MGHGRREAAPGAWAVHVTSDSRPRWHCESLAVQIPCAVHIPRMEQPQACMLITAPTLHL